MKKLFRWAGWIILSLVFLVGSISAGAYGLLTQTVASPNGQASVSGLGNDVKIVRDAHSIPHIEAESRSDVLHALGWVHASERMWQMEVLRMAGQGRLSEMFGEKTVSSDLFLKTLDIADAAQNSVKVLSPKTLEYLNAYSAGVNAWINRETGAFEPSLPAEFIILGHNPEPWEPWQSLTVLKVMALTLDANMDEEIGRLALAGKGFEPQQIDEIYSIGPKDNPPQLPDLRALYGFDKKGKNGNSGKKASVSENEPAMLATAPWTLQLPASNNWAISGRRTESGKPLLANDPHLGLTSPSVFYLAHMKWQDAGQERNLIGGTLPGTPLMLSGRNDNVAWGLTTTYLDSQDLFLEQINPLNPDEYRTEDGFVAFGKEDVVIKVKGGEDVPFVRRTSRHGPVLPDGYKKLWERLPDNHVAALSWTALVKDDTTVDGIFAIADASDVGDFMIRSRTVHSPMQSIVVADVNGKIGVIAPGKVPIRSRFNQIAGRAPVPGWIPLFGWQGFLGPYEQPIVVDPLSGAVATANANWLPEKYKHHITFDWAEHFRQDRVEELFVKSNSKHSMASMIAGQGDTKSTALTEFRDEILRQLPQGVLINEQILNAMERWDGAMLRDSSLPLILTAWHRQLEILMLKDDLGDDFELVKKGNITRILAMLRSTGARDWCNDLQTPEAESCSDILFKAGNLALEELEEKYGRNWQEWRWGTANLTLHEHRPFTHVDLLNPYFTIRQEMDGGKYTLLRNSFDFSKDEPYAGTHGSALRTIYDFSDFEKSLVIISTGQSGNVMSPHYDDLSKLWGEMKYVPLVTKPENYEKGALGTLILKAASN